MLLREWHEKQGRLKERRSLRIVSSAVYFKTLILPEYPLSTLPTGSLSF